MSLEITLLYFFSWNFILFWWEEPIKVPNFRFLISPNLDLDRLIFCWIYTKFQLKSTEELLCLITLTIDAKFEEKLICCFKNDENLMNFDPSTQKFQKLELWLVPSVMFDLKKYRVVIFDDIRKWFESWLKKTWLAVWKITWGIWQIFIRALARLKIVTLLGFFCPKLKMYELKIYRGVICHYNEEWCENWRGIDLSVQNWHKEFDEFWPEHSKISKICTLMGFFWTKYIMFDLKKYRGVMFGSTEYWCKIWRKTDFCFQKWHKEFGKFSPEYLIVWKLGLWWNPFIQSRKCISLKFTSELFVITMKKDAKIGGGIDL